MKRLYVGQGGQAFARSLQVPLPGGGFRWRQFHFGQRLGQITARANLFTKRTRGFSASDFLLSHKINLSDFKLLSKKTGERMIPFAGGEVSVSPRAQ